MIETWNVFNSVPFFRFNFSGCSLYTARRLAQRTLAANPLFSPHRLLDKKENNPLIWNQRHSDFLQLHNFDTHQLFKRKWTCSLSLHLHPSICQKSVCFFLNGWMGASIWMWILGVLTTWQSQNHKMTGIFQSPIGGYWRLIALAYTILFEHRRVSPRHCCPSWFNWCSPLM